MKKSILLSLPTAAFIAMTSCERVDQAESKGAESPKSAPAASTPAPTPAPAPAPAPTPAPTPTPAPAPAPTPAPEPTPAPAPTPAPEPAPATPAPAPEPMPETPAPAPEPTPAPEAPAPAPAASGEMETIKPEWPKEQFIGTPVPTDLPNLEDPAANPPRLEFQVPKGATNLAAGKPSTSSTEIFIIGDIAMVTDGDKEGADGSYVELDPGVQWVQVDLEQEAVISKVLVWHRHSKASAYKAVAVQISDDPEFKTGVTTVWNSDIDNVLGFGAGQNPAYVETNHGRIIDVDNLKGRYVRLWSNGNTGDDLNHYTEVEVWGLPAAQ